MGSRLSADPASVSDDPPSAGAVGGGEELREFGIETGHAGAGYRFMLFVTVGVFRDGAGSWVLG